MVKEEIFVAYRDEQGELTNIVEINGSAKFFRLKKLTRAEVNELLGAEELVK